MSEAKDLREETEQEEEQELETVAVLDDVSAEMMLQHIRDANEQYEKMASWYEFQLNKAKTIRDRTVAWAERCLMAYFDMVPTRDSKTQRSYELRTGKLVLKAQQPEYERDDDALVPWLKENGMAEMIKVKETANWAELKKQLKEAPDGTAMTTIDGEVVPGIKVTQREPKFSVTLK